MPVMEARPFVHIEEEMKRSFIDYAMSVIISRALPDVRDGLKPVQRRILVTLNDLGLLHNRPTRKCAKIAGDVSGNYHPHGETIVYPSLVRMAQPFALRYPLVEGQGNFGSVDGDEPAAMRYTEARMTRIAEEMLVDLAKDTVDFVPNYDGTRHEPVVLPARIPNLLINGSSGIAVGMATNIPPHNLGEVADGLLMLIENPEVSVQELMGSVKGPDFPTGSLILGTKGIRDAFETGRGLIRVRARTTMESSKRSGRESIVITEIPYQVNKAHLVEKIADLVKSKRIEGIADVRDESDRTGMRVVIELKKDEQPTVILNQLYKHTAMQSTFGIISLALVDNQPRVLNLKELLSLFLDHRKEVVLRRTRHDLEKAREKAHILEGLKTALDRLDQVISTIRRSASAQEARDALMAGFSLSQLQAQAILDMRLQRLTAMERAAVASEREKTLEEIKRYEAILQSDAMVRNIIKEELLEIKERYADARLTDIVPEPEELTYEDLIADEEMVVTITHAGYVKRSPAVLYRSQRRGGKGVMGMMTKEEDFVEHLFIASTHSYLMLFTNGGRAHWLKVHEIPEAGRTGKGRAVVNYLKLLPGEKTSAIVAVKDFEKGKYLVMATRKGKVKKMMLSEFSRPRTAGIKAISLRDDDELISVRLSEGGQNIVVATRKGMAICFGEDQVRPMGRSAAGVNAIRLKSGDEVIGMEVALAGSYFITVTENGFGKRTSIDKYRPQCRGGSGLKNIKNTAKKGNAVAIALVQDEGELMLVTQEGKVIRFLVADLSSHGRISQGVKLIDLEDGDRLVGLAMVRE